MLRSKGETVLRRNRLFVLFTMLFALALAFMPAWADEGGGGGGSSPNGTCGGSGSGSGGRAGGSGSGAGGCDSAGEATEPGGRSE